MQMAMEPSGWELMQDGAVYVLFNHQGGPRGGDEFVVPNWWMGMWMRQRGAHQFGLSAMLSLDAATVGKSGYREIFQVGEALEGKPLIDYGERLFHSQGFARSMTEQEKAMRQGHEQE